MGVSARAVVGPLSYLATAAIIETLKLLFVVNLVIANCSCIVHCIILVKFSLINRFQDSSIKGAILLLSLVFYLPILANLIRVGVGQPKSKLKKLMFRIFFMHFRTCQWSASLFTIILPCQNLSAGETLITQGPLSLFFGGPQLLLELTQTSVYSVNIPIYVMAVLSPLLQLSLAATKWMACRVR